MPPPDTAELGSLLERVYADCHRVDLIDPDPLLVVRSYGGEADRELVALFSAAMALGRASLIMDAARRCLAPFGNAPSAAIAELGPVGTRDRLGIEGYRFFSRRDLSALLSGISALQTSYGSLDAAFSADEKPEAPSSSLGGSYRGPSARLLSRSDVFVDRLLGAARSAASIADSFRGAAHGEGPALARNLFPAPRDGSACKRAMLFLRWMVRRDDVDIGAWTSVSPAELVIPLDTHLHRTSLALGLTGRKTADLAAALETTDALRVFDPADPVRFDFSLARLGIRSDYSLKEYLYT